VCVRGLRFFVSGIFHSVSAVSFCIIICLRLSLVNLFGTWGSGLTSLGLHATGLGHLERGDARNWSSNNRNGHRSTASTVLLIVAELVAHVPALFVLPALILVLILAAHLARLKFKRGLKCLGVF